MKFIFADNYSQYKDFLRRKCLTQKEAKYVSCMEHVCGIELKRTDLVFLGDSADSDFFLNYVRPMIRG